MKAILEDLKRRIPTARKAELRRLLARARHFGFQRRCDICQSRLRGFLPHGLPQEADFLCPVCRSKPPHRLALAYFQANPRLFTSGGTFVHVAPEPGLGIRLAAMAAAAGMRYRAGGITGSGESYLDLLHLPFADRSVDLVYCCHVLNSLQDDRAAIREVRRVLRPGGVAALQVPAFRTGPATLETNGLEERMAVFGDAGIFRCYTPADYENRLREAGFEVEAFHAVDLPAERIRKSALKREVLHLCRIPA